MSLVYRVSLPAIENSDADFSRKLKVSVRGNPSHEALCDQEQYAIDISLKIGDELRVTVTCDGDTETSVFKANDRIDGGVENFAFSIELIEGMEVRDTPPPIEVTDEDVQYGERMFANVDGLEAHQSAEVLSQEITDEAVAEDKCCDGDGDNC